MSQKFISLDDAAAKLGVPKERLNQLREAGDLRAYRDGSSWKFRSEEIDKLESEGMPADDDDALAPDSSGLSLEDPPTPGPIDADEPLEVAVASDEDDDIGLGVEPLGDGDDAESILLTDDEVGPPRPQSTIIGKSDLSLESDLALAAGSDAAPGGPASSTPALAGESGELQLDMGSSVQADKGGSAAAKSDLNLDDDEFELDLAGSDASASAAGSVTGLSGLDAIDLAADDDDDMVLGGSEGSDPAAGDSGVNLAPSDSGFSLDQVPPDLSGSAIGSSLDLAALSSAGSAASGLGGSMAGEDFQLTPDESGDEEEDSSQVVSLDEMEESEEDLPAFDSIDDDDDGGFGEGLGQSGLGAGSSLGVEPAGMAVSSYSAQEITFPGYIIAFLGATLLVALLGGFLSLELLRSMWTYEEPFSFTSGVMESLAGLISG